MVYKDKAVGQKEEKAALNDLNELRLWLQTSFSEIKEGLNGLKGLDEDSKLIKDAIISISVLEEVNELRSPDLRQEIRSSVKKELHIAAEEANREKSQNAAFSYLNQFVYKSVPLVGTRMHSFNDTNANDEYSKAIYLINDLRLELELLKENAKSQGSEYRIVSKFGGIGNKASVERTLRDIKELLDTSNIDSGVNAIRNCIVSLEIQKEIIVASSNAKEQSRQGALVGKIVEYLDNYEPILNHYGRNRDEKKSETQMPESKHTESDKTKTDTDDSEKEKIKISKNWKSMMKDYVEGVIWADAILKKEENKALSNALLNNSLTDGQAIALYKLLMAEWCSINKSFASSLLPKVNAIETTHDMLLVGRMAIKKYLNEFTKVKLDSMGFSKEHIDIITKENETASHYLLEAWEEIQLRLWQLFLSKKKNVTNETADMPPPSPLLFKEEPKEEASGSSLGEISKTLYESMPPPLPA